MKKIISIFITCITILCVINLPVFATSTSNIKDNADLFTKEDEVYLQEKIEKIEQEYGYKVTFVSKDNLADEDERSDFEYNYGYDYIDSKSDKDDRGVVVVYTLLKNEKFGYYELYYGKYSYSNSIDYRLGPDTLKLRQSSDTDAEFFDGYLTLLNDYLAEAETLPDAVADSAEETNLISGYDSFVDSADIFTDEEEGKIYARVKDIHEKYDFDITFLTMDEIPNGVKFYGDELIQYCHWYEGIDTSRDGLIYALNMNPENRGFATSTRGEAIDIVNYAALKTLDSKVPPLLTDGDYYKALNLYLDNIEKFLEVAETGEYYEEPKSFLTLALFLFIIPLALALIIASFIVNGILVGQMKTAVIQEQAKNFIVKDSLNLTRKTDTFLYETETRTYQPKTSDSGSSSGGSSSGAGGSRGGSSGSF